MKISNLIEYFAEVRKRPGMYLGANTITKLNDHLNGYKMAYWFNEIDNPIEANFFENFNEFVSRYYEVGFNSWAHIILEQSFGREEEALEKFFELFDLFIEKVEPPNTKKTVMAFFDKLVLEQDHMKVLLGDNFTPILNETFELIKSGLISDFKSEYDFILEELNEKAEQIPELKKLLTDCID